MARLLYSLLIYLATPLILLRLLWRARKQPEYLRNLGERWGFYRTPAPGKLIWVHAGRSARRVPRSRSSRPCSMPGRSTASCSPA